MKKFTALLLALTMVFALCACGGETPEEPAEKPADAPAEAPADEGVTIQVAAIATAYMDAYPEMWQEVCDAFTEETGIKVQLVTDKMLEDVIGPAIKAGNSPDYVHLALGREMALPETLIKDEALTEVTDVMDMTIPGEDAKVSEKVLPAFLGSSKTNPYGDDRIFLAPMFNNPCGLFYNAGFFEEKGWEFPSTWDEMWELAEKAEAEDVSLFCYATHGYLQEFFFSLVYAVGGDELFNAVTNYEEGVWETEGGRQVLEIMAKLAQHTHKDVPAQDNGQDFLKNQQLILDNQALIIPNGPWIVGEMADAPKGDEFKWAMAPIPAAKEGGDRYALSWAEQCWIPASAAHPDEAKQFMAFMYSDRAQEIFAKGGAYQPTVNATDYMDEQTAEFFSVFNQPGVKAAVGAFATTDAVEGVSTDASLFAAVNSLVSGNMTLEEYTDGVIAATDALRAAKK